MKLLRVPQDAVKVSIDTLTALLAGVGRTENVSADLPAGWTPTSAMHVQVAFDGTSGVDWPVRTVSTVRVVVWGSTPSEVRALAGLCMGLLLTQHGVAEGVGLLPAKDPNGAYLASFTVLWSLWAVENTP